ncbi:metallophosphoesterase [Candidatus Uabimicrobium sp. HlEnr_7]|uniref:metallophosphoesterase family protein n=1 Tax=Candidatus Uabimicrobium helgolandensis TaxID=3095367 RepID=UPI003558D000
MKFLAFADNHGSYQSSKRIIELAKNVDLLICVGDFTINRQFGDLFLKRIAPLEIPTLIVSGNHEEYPQTFFPQLLQDFSFTQNLDNTFYEKENTVFCGCSFTASREKSSILQQLSYHKKINIFMTHCPPIDSVGKDQKISDGGSLGIRNFIEETQPNLVLCGHIHSPLQREEQIGNSRIVNVACQYRIFEF